MYVSFLFAMREPAYELAAYSYVRIELNGLGIHVYRLKMGIFQFRVRLPWLHITNTDYRRAEKFGDSCRTVSEITWRILRWRSKHHG